MTKTAQNLKDLRYIIELTTPSGHCGACYFVANEHDPKLRKIANDPHSDINMWNHVYFSITLTDALPFKDPKEAVRTANTISDAYATSVVPVSAKQFFLANLKSSPVVSKQ